jgi:GABA(A) receptor-associated protein
MDFVNKYLTNKSVVKNETPATDYKSANSLEFRKKEASTVLAKYPDKIPVICEIHKSSRRLITLDHVKYLVSHQLTIGQFLITMRKKVKMDATQNLFLFSKHDTLFSTTQLLSEAYKENKDEDGFIYFTISVQETFG